MRAIRLGVCGGCWCHSACVYVCVGACTETCEHVCVCVCVCVSASARVQATMSGGCLCFSVCQFNFVLYVYVCVVMYYYAIAFVCEYLCIPYFN